MREASLAHQPDSHDASGNPHVSARILQLLGSFLRVFRKNFRDSTSKVVIARISLLTESFDSFQLIPPQLVDILVQCQRVLCDYDEWAHEHAKVNSDYKQVSERDRFSSDFQQFEIDGHPHYCIDAQP